MEFRKTKLKNGLTILHEKRDVPVTSVMLAVKYGSGYEKEEEKGTAHFIEHLCFKGTERRSAKEIASSIEKVGGVLNAFTGEEETAYFVKIPSDYLELAMDVLFDVFFNPVFPENEIEKERNVIREEIRMYRDNPCLYSLLRIKQLLYGGAFGMFGAGSEENIMKIKREDLARHHKNIYVSENAILCVVGNNKFEDVVRFAEKFCIEGRSEKRRFPKLQLVNKEAKEVRKDLQQAHFVLGFHFPYEDVYSIEVFNAIYGRGMSSRLFEEVREKLGLVYAIKTELDIGRHFGYLVVYAGTNKLNVGEVKKICLSEFRKMGQLSERELEEGKKQVIGNYNIEKEDSSTVALNLVFEEIRGNAEDYYNFEKRINEVGLDDIKKISEIKKFSSFVLSS